MVHMHMDSESNKPFQPEKNTQKNKNKKGRVKKKYILHYKPFWSALITKIIYNFFRIFVISPLSNRQMVFSYIFVLDKQTFQRWILGLN